MGDARFNRSPLHVAALDADLALVEKLIAEGADLEAKDDFGYTPLLAAAEMDKIEVTRTLLKAGAKIVYRFQREETKEARVEQEKQIRQSFEESEKAHPEVYRDHFDSKKEAEAFLEEMVAEGVQFAFEPVTKCVVEGCGSLEMAKLLFEEFDADINHLGGDGYHPLKTFAEACDAEGVAWLLKHGAKVDLTYTGDTALHTAVKADSLECATVLLDAGADPNAEDVDGWNLLFSVHGQPMLDLLLARGAKIAPDTADFLPSGFVEDEMIPAMRELEKAAGFGESPAEKRRRELESEDAGGDPQTDL